MKPKQHLKVVSGGKKIALDPLSKLEFGKPVRTHVREFGVVIALACVLIAMFQAYYRPDRVGLILGLLVGGGAFWGICLTATRAMVPVWRGWMAVGHAMGMVVTTVILLLCWIGMVIPIAFILKVFGIKVMNTTFKAPAETYWDSRDSKLSDFKLMERQF